MSQTPEALLVKVARHVRGISVAVDRIQDAKVRDVVRGHLEAILRAAEEKVLEPAE